LHRYGAAVRSWARPLGLFHPFLLGGFMLAAWAIYTTGMVLTDGGWRFVIGALSGLTFGLALGECMIRLRHPEPVMAGVMVPRWDKDELPPPGFALLTCERCGDAGLIPAGLPPARAICGQCGGD
jgi:hypothetical protein